MNNQDNASNCIRNANESSRSSTQSDKNNQSESGNHNKNINGSPSLSKCDKNNQSLSGNNNENAINSISSKKNNMADSGGKKSAKQVATNTNGTSRKCNGKEYYQDDNRQDIKFQVKHKNPLFPRY